ncbi:MAG: hypothetical protein LBR38_06745 [Synergistaceae bacterium]|jgi:lipopolysaccharide biosynthesis glycosyltransferase|nr:hypothetical protein [Synergistaceae bacterium]
MGYDPDNYFGGPVLVMNLDRIRREYDLAREALLFFGRYSSIASLADEDFLNSLFRDDILPIDERFCRSLMTARHESDVDVNNAILHYTDRPLATYGAWDTVMSLLRRLATYLRTHLNLGIHWRGDVIRPAVALVKEFFRGD